MLCFICGQPIKKDLEYYTDANYDKKPHHSSCDPEIIVAKVSQVIAKPLNVKKYKASPSGQDYSVIDKNIIKEI